MEDNSKDSNQMVPSNSEEPWWGSWSRSWIDVVKEKSAVTIEMVKKDLNEFVEVIQGDTSEVISTTASKIDSSNDDEQRQSNLKSATKVVKKGVSNFLHSVSEFISVAPDDTQEEIIAITDDASLPSDYNRKQEKLHAIQTNPGTYCNEPEGLFSEWLDVFNLDDHKLVMSNMLVQNPAIRGIYTQLVPAVVSHTTFWQRYFYQVFLLEAEEKKREEIVARANNESSKEEMADWDDEDYDIEVISDKMLSIKTEHSRIIDVGTARVEFEDILVKKNTDMIKEEHVTEIMPVNKADSNISACESANTIGTEVLPVSTSNLAVLVSSATSNSEENKISKGSENLEIANVEETFDKSSNIIEDTSILSGSAKEMINMGKAGGISTSAHSQSMLRDPSETSSLSSWMSIDDVIKVKKISGEQMVKSESVNGHSANISSDSNGVMIHKSDVIDESDEDFDIDIEEEVNEEEIAKMVQEIKDKSVAGTLHDDEDDDWENWE